MANTPDATALWQQWRETQQAWQTITATQSSPDLKDVFQHVNEMSALYMELAQKVLPHTHNPPNQDTLKHWLQALEETVGVWSKRKAMGVISLDAMGAVLHDQVAHWSNLQCCVQSYQSISTRYQQAFTELQQAAFNDLSQQLTMMSAAGDAPQSLRQLVDSWGSHFEARYQQWVSSDDYQSLYGELTNTSVELKAAFQAQIEPLLTMINIPTRPELNAVYERLQVMRRENQVLRTAIEQLTHQVAQLSSQLASVATQSPNKVKLI